MYNILRYLFSNFILLIFPVCYVYAICKSLSLMNLFNFHKVMGTPLRSPLQSDGQSEATSRKSRQSIRLRRLTLRTLDQPRPTVNVNATIG